MIIPNLIGLGFRVFAQAGEQQEANAITNMTYKTPYQIPFKGLLLETDTLSTTYDATSTPTQCVATPAGNGAYVDGWAYITSYAPRPLNYTTDASANTLYPLTVDIGESGYAEDQNNWVNLTVTPLIPGQLVGVPVYANVNLTQGLEVAAATGGFARPAASGDWVCAKVEWAANNTGGASGAKVASVRVCHQYKKA